MRVGVVGFGGFGRFAAGILSNFIEVVATDIFPSPSELGQIQRGSLKEVANCHVVILAINLGQLEGVLREISPHLKPNTLVVDVCSVKIKPIELMQNILPEYVDILGTHPLFGPQSARSGLPGHKIVLCPVRIREERFKKIKTFLGSLGLDVVEENLENHDREMALVQGLTHFVARAMIQSGVRPSALSTKAYDSLFGVLGVLNPGSWELFQTIELGNPFAGEIRRKFLQELQQLEEKLKE